VKGRDRRWSEGGLDRDAVGVARFAELLADATGVSRARGAQHHGWIRLSGGRRSFLNKTDRVSGASL
jgi:hypothetical protein